MRKFALSIGLMIFGVFLEILAAANGWGWLITLAGFIVSGGFAWMIWTADKLDRLIKPVPRYTRRVDKLGDQQKNHEAYQELMNKSVGNKLNELQKRSGQNIKGQVVYINGKEVQE